MKTKDIGQAILVASGICALLLTFGSFAGSANADLAVYLDSCSFDAQGNLTGYTCKGSGTDTCEQSSCTGGGGGLVFIE